MIEDTDRRAPRWPWMAMAALGLASTVAATMCVIKAGGVAITGELTGDLTGEAAGAPRTVIATAAANSPNIAPEAGAGRSLSAEVPVLMQTPGVADAQPQDLREIVYTIDGNQRPDDPVTVVYADETGTLQTLQNVTLPWTMALIPNLPVNYVTANSAGSQLNCWITDAAGATVARQTDYGPSTTCNR